MGLYQGSEDEKSEALVLERLMTLYGVDHVRMPKVARMDAILTRDGVSIAVVEIKHRKYSLERMQELGSIYVDKSKLQIGQFIAKSLAIKFLFVAKLTDALLVVAVDPNDDLSKLEHSVSKLNRPRDLNDADEVILLPVEKFRVIE